MASQTQKENPVPPSEAPSDPPLDPTLFIGSALEPKNLDLFDSIWLRGVYFLTFLCLSIILNESKPLVDKFVHFLEKYSPTLAKFVDDYFKSKLIRQPFWFRLVLCFILFLNFIALGMFCSH